MKHTLLLSVIFLTSFHAPESKVYICGSKGAKKYHYKENCRGLNSCRNELTVIPISKAQGFGLTLCGWED